MPNDSENLCRCDYITALLNDPDSGITVTENGTYVHDDPFVWYYCPHCGGRMPNFWNAHIPDEERERLQRLIEGITTIDEAIQRLGPADYNAPMGRLDSIDGRVVNEELPRKCRKVEYYNLSDYADVAFYFQEDSQPIAHIVLKYNP